MTWGSTAPGVIDALVTLLRSQLGQVDVIDGPIVSGATLSEAVTIGFQDAELGGSALEAQLAMEGYSRDPLREQYSVSCSVAVLASTNDVVSARARAFALLSQVGSALDVDPVLGGLVLAISIGEFSLHQATDRVRVLFAIDVDAYTTEP